MTDLTPRAEETLYERVAQIIETARAHVSRTVNTSMVHAYWLIGREIVEVQQAGKDRAEYGEQIVKRLAARLSTSFGKGFSYPSVKRMKQFYLTFQTGSVIPEELGQYKKGSARLSQSNDAAVSKKGAALLSQSQNVAPVIFPPLLSWTHYLTLMRVDNSEARAFLRDRGSPRELVYP